MQTHLNTQLRIAVVKSNPSTSFISTANGTIIINGVLKEFLRFLTHFTNLSYTVHEPNDGYEYGTKVNNSWNGIIGMLVRNECDITLTPLDVTYERSTDISYSTVITTTPYTIITSKTNYKLLNTNRVTDYLLDVDFIIWIILIIAIVVIIIIEWIRYRNIHKLSDICWNFTRLVLNQSDVRSFKSSLYLTTFFGVWFLFLCLFINIHIGVELVVGTSDEKINNLSELADAEHIIPVIYTGTAIESFFRDSDIDDNAKIWNRITCNRHVSMLSGFKDYANPELIRLLLSRKIALLELQNDVTAIKTFYCEINARIKLIESFESYLETPLAFGFNKLLNNNISETINKLVSKTIAHGFVNAWKMGITWHTTSINSLAVMSCVYDQILTTIDRYTAISLTSAHNLLYLIVIGYLCAILVLILEKFRLI